jgi:hypothetical protein
LICFPRSNIEFEWVYRDAGDFGPMSFIEFLLIGGRVIKYGYSGGEVDKESGSIREVVIIRVIVY